MNEEVINDLKQFISATVSQQFAVSADDVKTDILKEVRNLDAKIDTISSAIAEVLDTNNEVVETQLKYHESRITKLESTTA